MINYVHVPVGNAVLLKYKLPFANSVGNNSFTFEYKIDSQNIGETTLERHSKLFSAGGSIFTKLILRNIKTNQLEYDMNDDQKYLKVYLCTPAISFGKHSTIVNRTILNQTDKIMLSTKYIILPKKLNCIENENCDEHLMANDVDKIYLLYEESTLFQWNTCHRVVLWLISCISFTIFIKSYKMVNKKICNVCNVCTVFCNYVLGHQNGSKSQSNLDGLGIIITLETPTNSYMDNSDVLIFSTEHDNEIVQTICHGLQNQQYILRQG